MGDDISTMSKVGIQTTLVAFIITMVLILVAVAQGITAKGLNSFQSGAGAIANQEFERYNQNYQYGTEVRAAINLYQASDIAIIVRTKACLAPGSTVKGYMYNALITGGTGGTTNPTVETDGVKIQSDGFLVRAQATDTFYTAEFYKKNGVIQRNNNVAAITVSGDIQYIRESAKFTSELIKNGVGETIGIVFTQLDI